MRKLADATGMHNDDNSDPRLLPDKMRAVTHQNGEIEAGAQRVTPLSIAVTLVYPLNAVQG